MFKHYKLLLALLLPFFVTRQATAQSLAISGVVTAKSDGSPLAGVTINDVTNSSTVIANAEGKFTINAHIGDLLKVTYIGFETQEITIKENTTSLQIILQDGQNSLNEVVVTALNISKEKKTLGYSVQGLKAKDIAEAKETNLVNALTGKIAGVNVTSSQGDMGSSRIVIRGETSIAGDNQPLFVVDGIPVDNSQLLGNAGSRDFANAIADINAEDIESLTVLKGPNAAALYGSRAAHGVILIKTKTGKGAKGFGVTINSNTSFSNLLGLPKYQNEFGQGSDGKFSYVDGKGGGVNDGVDESWGPPLDGRLIPQFNSNGVAVPFIAHPDNVRSFFKTGVAVNNGVSLAGSGDKYDFRLGYNNLHQTGVIPNSEQGKNSFILNATYKLTPKLTLSTVANYIKDDASHIPGSGGKRSTSTMLEFTWFGRQVDVTQLKNYLDANGNTFNWNNSYYSNPYWLAYQNTVGQTKNRFIGNIELNYKIIDGLSANFRTGTDYYNDRRKIRIAYGTNGTPFGSYEEDGYDVSETNTEGRLQYTKKLNSDFSVDALLGGNIRVNSYEENDQKAPKLAVSGLYTLSNSRDPLISSNVYSKYKVYSYFASGQVGFRDYAFLNVTARNDWSSTLPKANLSYFYPSVNGSLILSQALDIKSDVLSYLKIRGGWSKVGNDTQPYKLLNTYDFTAPFGTNPQQSANSTDLNPNLKPETTTSAEAGLEINFFDDRIRLDASVYNTNSINQILSVNVSQTTGYTQKLINGGTINNKGLEIVLGLTPVKLKDFKWDINVNYSRNHSKVVSLDPEGRLQSYLLGSDGTVQVLAAVGKPYGSIYGTTFERNANGQLIISADGTPAVNPTNQYLGKYTPDWLGSISNSFTYKGINLSVLIDAHVRGSIYSGTNATGTYTGILASTLPGRGAANGGLTYTTGTTVNHDGMIFDGVNADGSKNTTVISAQSYYKALTNADAPFVYNATYIKLREIKLGYTIPQQWAKAIGFQAASIAAVGRNLLIIHKNAPNIDPETAFNTGNGQGLEDLTLPTVRNIGFNINLKF
ncbi:SusC/RagA family TonB-linked outer membrane protein [Mucilaginibacter corticis]|uniref:SusC/RagA family TonB-linked outer membrane protein n=1 Tax=Mucilaginibacter corticis TaxID=2597670 RepID=A0A556MIJ7_9SPHI|nr:SusC/RagA family TonB-linked outer membrane protein [Mucilaginibacter corticis]TSJ39740.1 SusC/RagA family TonB-linked outer membrane protein [Mucilaginibacter corticis]